MDREKPFWPACGRHWPPLFCKSNSPCPLGSSARNSPSYSHPSASSRRPAAVRNEASIPQSRRNGAQRRDSRPKSTNAVVTVAMKQGENRLVVWPRRFLSLISGVSGYSQGDCVPRPSRREAPAMRSAMRSAGQRLDDPPRPWAARRTNSPR